MGSLSWFLVFLQNLQDFATTPVVLCLTIYSCLNGDIKTRCWFRENGFQSPWQEGEMWSPKENKVCLSTTLKEVPVFLILECSLWADLMPAGISQKQTDIGSKTHGEELCQQILLFLFFSFNYLLFVHSSMVCWGECWTWQVKSPLTLH